MRKTLLAALMAAGMSAPMTSELMAAPSSQAATLPAGYRMFTSVAGHYQIAYPATWSVRKSYTIQYFIGEPGGKPGTFVQVVTETARASSLEGYTALVKGRLLRTGGQVQRVTSITIGGLPARLIDSRFSRPKFGLSGGVETAVFLARGKAWQIALTADPSLMGLAVTKFRIMLSSFRLR